MTRSSELLIEGGSVMKKNVIKKRQPSSELCVALHIEAGKTYSYLINMTEVYYPRVSLYSICGELEDNARLFVDNIELQPMSALFLEDGDIEWLDFVTSRELFLYLKENINDKYPSYYRYEFGYPLWGGNYIHRKVMMPILGKEAMRLPLWLMQP